MQQTIKRTKFLSEKYRFKYGKVSIKNYKSRWGTCYKNKDITLNTKLVCLNEKVIDYVFIVS